MASLTVLTASGIGLVAAPMAFGQIIIPIGGPIGNTSQGAGVTNAGSASANSGGNTAIGNNSTNTATATSPAGSLLNVPITLGAPTNVSDGSAAITTGTATAAGNSSDTRTGQSNASENQVSSFLGSQQGARVVNSGSGGANSGGNTAIGNNSDNTATVTQDVSGGLLGVGVTLGGPTNTSTGRAAINTGAANATGNTSSTDVGQASQQGGVTRPGGPAGRVGIGSHGGPGGGVVACGGRFASLQNANVRNQGEAEANTGNNTAIGNNSANNASANLAGSGQTVSGGLLGVGITIGGPMNNSTGTAVISTGSAAAVGNDSSTEVGQVQACPQVAAVAAVAAPGRPGVIVPAGGVQQFRTATLARTGLDTGDLGMIAGALLGAGALLIASQRRRMAARAVGAVPMAGFGFGMGADDWDRAAR